MLSNTPRPLVVVWRLTEACDLSCWFCEFNRRLQRPRHSARAADVLAFGQVLADYAARSGRPVLVSWLGGEPLLWPPLRQVGQHFRRELGLSLGLTTSGERLSAPGLLEHLADLYAEVTVSVDGLAEFHDAVRGAHGLFARLRAAVMDLRRRRADQGRGPLIRANTILMHSNLRHFEPLSQELGDWGIEEITFNALGGQPPGPGYAKQSLTPDDVAWLRAELPGLRQRLAARGLVIRGGERYLGRLASSAAGEAVPVADCHPGADFLFIDERGRAAPCSFTAAGYGVPIQQIACGDDLARLPARFSAARAEAWLPPCHDCPSTQVFGKFDLVRAA